MTQFSEIMTLINSLSLLSEDELTERISSEVSRAKQSGQFDYDKISHSVMAILPYLSQAQQQKILSILDQIKNA